MAHQGWRAVCQRPYGTRAKTVKECWRNGGGPWWGADTLALRAEAETWAPFLCCSQVRGAENPELISSLVSQGVRKKKKKKEISLFYPMLLKKRKLKACQLKDANSWAGTIALPCPPLQFEGGDARSRPSCLFCSYPPPHLFPSPAQPCQCVNNPEDLSLSQRLERLSSTRTRIPCTLETLTGMWS